MKVQVIRIQEMLKEKSEKFIDKLRNKFLNTFVTVQHTRKSPLSKMFSTK